METCWVSNLLSEPKQRTSGRSPPEWCLAAKCTANSLRDVRLLPPGVGNSLLHWARCHFARCHSNHERPRPGGNKQPDRSLFARGRWLLILRRRKGREVP